MTDSDLKAAKALSTRASKTWTPCAPRSPARTRRVPTPRTRRGPHTSSTRRAEPSRRTVRLSRPGTRWRPTRRHRRATAGAGQRWPIAPGTAGHARQRWRAPLPSSVSEIEIGASVDESMRSVVAADAASPTTTQYGAVPHIDSGILPLCPSIVRRHGIPPLSRPRHEFVCR